eukprot:9356406-Heterocapsa_arctica.AAC.1
MHWSTSRVEIEEGCQGVSLRVLGVSSVNSQTSHQPLSSYRCRINISVTQILVEYVLQTAQAQCIYESYEVSVARPAYPDVYIWLKHVVLVRLAGSRTAGRLVCARSAAVRAKRSLRLTDETHWRGDACTRKRSWAIAACLRQ